MRHQSMLNPALGTPLPYYFSRPKPSFLLEGFYRPITINKSYGKSVAAATTGINPPRTVTL